MTTQEPTSAASVNSVAEAAERSHLALRRAVVDVAVSLVRAGVLSHSGHADLSARFGPDAVLASPHFLIGTNQEMAQDLRERRERWGFSYFTVREESMSALAPIVSELAGR